MRILEIEAWRDGDGWTWNNWFHVGNISGAEFECADTNRDILKIVRERTALTGQGLVTIEDDGCNLVIVQKNTREPLYAIEYGVDV